MKLKLFVCSIVALSLQLVTKAQNAAVIQQYIETYKDIAIAEMQRTGVPASIKLAQGIHETAAGTSILVTKSNNHFGIKCKSNWTGQSVKHTDDAPNECFRKYDEPGQSYKDHSDFLRNGQRYAFLFNLEPTDYKGWANGLKKAGYATNPKYPQIIIKLIEDYHLDDYTLIAMGKMEPRTSDIAVVNKPVEQQPAVMQAAVVEKPAVVKPSYPDGVFKINDTKVVFIKAGTSFLALAQQHNIPLKRLFEFNDDMPEVEEADADQLIFLQRKRKTGAEEFHIVQPGETVYDVAQVQAIRLESLLSYNGITANKILVPGEKLYLKTFAPAGNKLASLK